MAAEDATGREDDLPARTRLPQRLDCGRPPTGEAERKGISDGDASREAAAPTEVWALRLMKLDTVATAPQKVLETAGPIRASAGTLGLAVLVSAIQLNGICHTVLVFGPCGPSLNPASRWPQCPVVVKPGKLSRRGTVGQQHGSGMKRSERPGGVVTAHTGAVLPRAQPQRGAVERCMRTGRGIDDRVRAVALDLGVGPSVCSPPLC